MTSLALEDRFHGLIPFCGAVGDLTGGAPCFELAEQVRGIRRAAEWAADVVVIAVALAVSWWVGWRIERHNKRWTP